MNIARKYMFFIAVFLLTFSIHANAEHVIDDSKNNNYLLVISATSGSFDGDTLTLNGVPNVVYFSDRPARVAGHYSLEQFLASWDKEENNFSNDPPNAVLSILDRDQDQNSVVELISVEQKNDALVFKVKALSGALPKEFKAASLFIDPVQETFPGVY